MYADYPLSYTGGKAGNDIPEMITDAVVFCDAAHFGHANMKKIIDLH